LRAQLANFINFEKEKKEKLMTYKKNKQTNNEKLINTIKCRKIKMSLYTIIRYGFSILLLKWFG